MGFLILNPVNIDLVTPCQVVLVSHNLPYRKVKAATGNSLNEIDPEKRRRREGSQPYMLSFCS